MLLREWEVSMLKCLRFDAFNFCLPLRPSRAREAGFWASSRGWRKPTTVTLDRMPVGLVRLSGRAIISHHLQCRFFFFFFSGRIDRSGARMKYHKKGRWLVIDLRSMPAVFWIFGSILDILAWQSPQFYREDMWIVMRTFIYICALNYKKIQCQHDHLAS